MHILDSLHLNGQFLEAIRIYKVYNLKAEMNVRVSVVHLQINNTILVHVCKSPILSPQITIADESQTLPSTNISLNAFPEVNELKYKCELWNMIYTYS